MHDNDIEAQYRKVMEVQARYADQLMQLPHVVGLGVGFAQEKGQETPVISIVVMVDEKVPAAQLAPEDVIPNELDGVRVDVQPTGSFTAFSA